MATQPKPTPWKDWPDLLAPKDLVELMPGFIGQKRAYSIARQIGKRYGRSYVIQKEDFFDWLTGDKTYSTALKLKEAKWTNE